MGTNYYLVCKACGHKVHHLGKQSAGWLFHTDFTKEEVKEWVKDKRFRIEDEYGKKWTLKTFLKRVTEKWEENCHVETNTNEFDWS